MSPDGVPGPKDMVGNFIRPDGTGNNGYYGEVSGSELCTSQELKTLVGITLGRVTNPDPGWLKFNVDGKILFIAKKTMSDVLSSDQMGPAAKDGVQVTIKGVKYLCRLVEGSKAVVTNQPSGSMTTGCEWNRTIYNVVLGSPAAEEGSKWAQFSLSDLGFLREPPAYNDNSLTKGTLIYKGVTYLLARQGAAETNGFLGNDSTTSWRPCLEVLP